jgi:hypothetical protein
MKRMKYCITSSVVAVVLFMSSGRMSAQSGPNRFVPFNEFMASTAVAGFRPSSSSTFSGGPTAGGIVADAASFEQMRHHIQDMYQDVQVSHSYVLGSQTFDCIPIDQQPSVRKQGSKGIAATPPAPVLPTKTITGQDSPAGQAAAPPSQLPASRYDAFGNALGCEAHTIPMRRLTLDEMSHFKTLQEFFTKGPNGAGKAPVAPAPGSAPTSTLGFSANSGSVFGPDAGAIPPSPFAHKHAYTYEWVNNVGGNSILNLWNPYVYTPWLEVFSLSQVWYIGGGQTVEAGWQNYPAKYGSENAALFIYWTADNYQNTGCYNLDCPGFVQVDNTWHFGSGFSAYSTVGGPQYELPIKWWLYYGNWWLSVNGTWVGYYPGSIYGGGQLSRSATLIEFGGETVADGGYGYFYYPPMGSGNWANALSQHAAYQRQIYYIDTANNSQWASLNAGTEAPACYSTDGPFHNSSWGIYFYFGGPGGRC